MARIELKHVDVEFPVFTRRGRSLKRALARSRVGGFVGGDDEHITLVRALSDISISLKDGDRLALIGHNGAGKTTLLKVMSQIYDPTRGLAEIDGRVSIMTDLMMGMDPEESGYENIKLRSIFLGLTSRQARDIVEDIEDFTELGEFLSLPLRTYSMGMLLRLCFAISTAIRPDILVMDELINVGDANFFAKARKRLADMLHQSNILVIATHDPNTAQNFCNKAVLLEGGSIVHDGTPKDVIAAYQERNKVDSS